MAGPLHDTLRRKRPLILDGAMGTELQRRGIPAGLPLWSANALLTHPDAVKQIHREYLEAGAEIITADTFRTTRRTFTRAGLPDRSEELTAAAVALARKARNESFLTHVLIAGSIAPLEDCYAPDLVPQDSALDEEHRELAERLARAEVDFILLETMGTIREASAACRTALATGKEVVVSFILGNDGNLLGGETLRDAVARIAPLQPSGFSLNCVSPRYLEKPVEELRSLTRLPIAVYGNIGLPESDTAGWEFTREFTEEQYAACALKWSRSGADIVGGCCGTTPGHIRALKKAFAQGREGTKV